MRKLLPLILFVACATQQAPPPAAPAPPAEPHGLTIEEEASILSLEDRREHDAAVIGTWVAHPNAQHRLRVALALGRIGAITKTGVPELTTLSTDPDRRVRETAAFALGQIGQDARIHRRHRKASRIALQGYTRRGSDRQAVGEELLGGEHPVDLGLEGLEGLRPVEELAVDADPDCHFFFSFNSLKPPRGGFLTAAERLLQVRPVLPDVVGRYGGTASAFCSSAQLCGTGFDGLPALQRTGCLTPAGFNSAGPLPPSRPPQR